MKTFVKILILAILAIGLCTILACPSGTSATTYPNATSADKPRMAAFSPGQVGPFVIPASWKQATWFIDNANTSGCASDNNRTCSSSSCTSGDGPCLTYGSVATRWGTYSPRLPQITTITVMSSMSPADVVYLNPAIEGPGHYLNWTCNIGSAQQAWTATLGAVTAKNRITPQLLAAVTVPGVGSVALKQFVTNTGPGGTGVGWVTRDQAGTTWNYTQPTTGCTTPQTACTPVENNAWALGDTVTASNLSNVYLATALPTTTTSTQTGTKPAVIIQGCAIQSTAGTIDGSAMMVNPYVQFVDDLIMVTMTDNMGTGGLGGPFGVGAGTNAGVGFVNVDFEGTPGSLAGSTWYAGMIGRSTNGFPALAGPSFAGDTVINNDLIITGSLPSQFQNGTNGATVQTDGLYVQFNLAFYSSFGLINAPIWGPCAVFVEANSYLAYPSSADAGQNNFLCTGGAGNPIRLDSATTGCAQLPSGGAGSAVNTFCGIPLKGTNLDLPAGDAGFGQHASSSLGASQIVGKAGSI